MVATSILPTVHRPLPSDSSFKSSLLAELGFQSGEKHIYVSQLRRLTQVACAHSAFFLVHSKVHLGPRTKLSHSVGSSRSSSKPKSPKPPTAPWLHGKGPCYPSPLESRVSSLGTSQDSPSPAGGCCASLMSMAIPILWQCLKTGDS